MGIGTWLKAAFAMETEEELAPSAEEAALVDRLARGIVQRGLATPAVIGLDCSHNLNFLASQSMLFFEPMIQAFFSGQEYVRMRAFLARRGSIEYICRRIESFADQPSAPAGDPPQQQTKDQLNG